MMQLYYEASDGTVIDFMSGPLAAQNPEALANNHWDYTALENLGRIKNFYKDIQESELTLQVFADDADQFNETMANMHKAFDRDVRRMTPGKLWWNDYYKEVFISETSHESFEELMEYVEKTLHIVSVWPYWVKKTTTHYTTQAQVVGTLDYPFDYAFDYGQTDFPETIINSAIDSSNFEIIFFGPCVNPSVTIAKHTYVLYTQMVDGEYAVINSSTKKITKYSKTGRAENIFYLRGRSDYIFEPIPEGTSSLIRSKALAVDVTLVDERGEPPWI